MAADDASVGVFAASKRNARSAPAHIVSTIPLDRCRIVGHIYAAFSWLWQAIASGLAAPLQRLIKLCSALPAPLPIYSG
jgi:hypothetical protein